MQPLDAVSAVSGVHRIAGTLSSSAPSHLSMGVGGGTPTIAVAPLSLQLTVTQPCFWAAMVRFELLAGDPAAAVQAWTHGVDACPSSRSLVGDGLDRLGDFVEERGLCGVVEAGEATLA